MVSRRARALAAVLLAAAVLRWPPPAAAQATTLHWYVEDEDDIEVWRRAAEEIWDPGTLAVERWVGPWPPSPDWRLAHAYLEGTPRRGVVVLRRGDGEERRLPALSSADDESARRSVLLLLLSIYVPLEVSDRGWKPELAPEPRPEPEPLIPLVSPETIEPEGTPRPLRFGIALGAANRVGMATGALSWRVRLGLDTGAPGPRPVARLRLVAEVSGEQLGFATIDAVDAHGQVVDHVDVRFDGVSLGGGAEGRFGSPEFSFVTSLVLAARQSWSRLRRDEPEAGQETNRWAPVPQLRVSVGVNLRMVRDVGRWGFHGIVAQELFRVEPGWVFRFEERDYWGPRSTSFHLVAELDFGGGRRR